MQNNLTSHTSTKGDNYTNSNHLILQAAKETATKTKSNKKGWFHFSRAKLLPSITLCDHLIHTLRTATDNDVINIKRALTSAQDIVTDNIALAKAKWPAHLDKQVHNMRFTPKNHEKQLKL